MGKKILGVAQSCKQMPPKQFGLGIKDILIVIFWLWDLNSAKEIFKRIIEKGKVQINFKNVNIKYDWRLRSLSLHLKSYIIMIAAYNKNFAFFKSKPFLKQISDYEKKAQKTTGS